MDAFPFQVQNLLSWSEDGKHHFRLKARYIFEKLFRKVGYKAVISVVPEKHTKFVSHAHKMVERRKRQRKKLQEVCTCEWASVRARRFNTFVQ